MVYLSTSKLACAVVGNLGFALALLLHKLLIKVIQAPWKPSGVERVQNSSSKGQGCNSNGHGGRSQMGMVLGKSHLHRALCAWAALLSGTHQTSTHSQLAHTVAPSPPLSIHATSLHGHIHTCAHTLFPTGFPWPAARH